MILRGYRNLRLGNTITKIGYREFTEVNTSFKIQAHAPRALVNKAPRTVECPEHSVSD